MTRNATVMLVACAAMAVTLTPAAAGAMSGPPTQKTSVNLIKNAGADDGPGSTGNETNTPPQWTVSTGTTFTALIYGPATGGPDTTSPGPPQRGANLFAGGSDEPLEVATQLDYVPTAFRAAVDAGTATYTLQAYLGGFSSQRDNARLSIEWRTASNAPLGSVTIGPVTPGQRNNVTGLLRRQATGPVPTGARRVLVTLTLTRTDGSYNDGYADSLLLKLGRPDVS